MPEELEQEQASYSNSRYAFTKKYLDDSVSPGRARLGRWREPEVNMYGYLRYSVEYGDVGRLDRIAYKFYEDVRLWPIIARVNGIRNQFEDMVVGQILLIPRVDSVKSIERAKM